MPLRIPIVSRGRPSVLPPTRRGGNMTARVRFLLALATFVCAFACGLHAQVTTAMLRGTVLDPSSAPVPDAQIKATNVDTGLTRSVLTNETGDYVIADLPYGTYEIRVLKSGFHELIRTGVVMNIGDRRT